MRTKNSARITDAERDHLERVKSSPCVLCDAPPPSIAHHVVQGDHWTCLSLCTECHVGKQGVHGDQTMLRLRYRSGGERGELLALNDTLKRIYG